MQIYLIDIIFETVTPAKLNYYIKIKLYVTSPSRCMLMKLNYFRAFYVKNDKVDSSPAYNELNVYFWRVFQALSQCHN